MNKKKYLAFLMVALAVFAFLPAYQISGTSEMRRRLADAQEQLNQARNQVRNAENALQGIRTDIDELMETMRDYDQRLMDAYADLEEIELVLLETEINLLDAAEAFDQAREERDQQEALFHERLRSMHEQGPVGHLNVLFQSSNFAEFLIGLEHVRSISSFDQQVLNDMQEAEERVANTINELSRLNTLFEDMHVQQEAAIVALEDVQEAHWAFLEDLEASEEGWALLLAVEEATERSIQEELGAIQREIRDYEAEQDRLRREAEQRRRQEEQRALAASLTFSGRFLWPVPGRTHISSYFGSRRHPIRGTNETHWGIDIPAPAGTRIVAAEAGVVRLSTWHGGYGNTVIIDHGDGYSTLYAHNSRNRVTVGQHVNQGDHIADVGTTGTSTGNHLHFEVRRNGVAVDPLPYLGRTRSR
ncbi:MAG: peptidoglycan DD-metalloendopeptidase family protein [Defluviitaleaceae bacterium]|nr:peptidoglycan DD-metalloendopeptidase family protein [Defluviitaleaceae bacterium]